MRKQIDGQISLFDYIATEEYEPKEYKNKSTGKLHRKQKTEQQKKDITQNKEQKEGQKTALSSVSFFKQCDECWCSDCKHNEKLNALPRDFAGVKKACPSCDFCLKDIKAEICEIGSYDNGCKLRYTEEELATLKSK